jgi:lipopolysaccharide export system protein LptA
MRRSELTPLLSLGLVLTCAMMADAQTGKKLPISPADAAKATAEASRMIERARANRDLETPRIAATKDPVKSMDAVVAQAKQTSVPKPSFAAQAREAESEKRFQDALTRVSPEGKAILAQAQSGTNPAMRTPDEASSPTGKTKASPLSNDGPGPKPLPLKSTPLTPPEKPPLRTIIDANRLFFDPDSGFGVFVDDVVLTHPEFNLTADELEIYMNKEEPKDDPKNGGNGDAAAQGVPPSNGPTAGELALQGAADAKPGAGELAPSQRKEGGNIKTAIARGKKVLITKMSPEGIPQTGIGREAVYDGATGNMILRGWPQIQKGNNLTVAKEATTYFIIKENGHFHAEGGRASTSIVQGDKQKAAPPPPLPGSDTPAISVPAAPVPGSNSKGGQQ